MLGLSFAALAAISAGILVGGVVKGITGIGLPIVTISIVITLGLLPPREAIALVVIPILITNLWQTVRARGLLEPLKRFLPMIVCFLFFLWLGSALLANMDTHVMFGVLGMTVMIFSASTLMRPRSKPLSPATERWAGPLAGTLGGLLGGISTIWGPPMMMYYVLLKLSKDDWVRAVGLVWFLGSVPLTFFYWQNGILNENNVWLSAFASIPGMIGIVIGEQLRKWINEEAFRKAMLIALFLIGLNLIRRALT